MLHTESVIDALLHRDATTEGTWQWNIERREMSFSPRALQLLGLEADQSTYPDTIIKQFVHPNDRQMHTRDLTRCLKGELDVFQFELKFPRSPSENVHLLCRGAVDREDNDRAARIVGTIVDVSEQRKVENALKITASAVSGAGGDAFYASSVEFLSGALGAEMALVGQLNECGQSVDTLAVWKSGQIAPNFTYQLNVSPCCNVVGKKICVFERDVWKTYPDDEPLVRAQIEGYVGAPLFDSNRNAIGLIAVLFKEPIKNPELCQNLLVIFAARVASEVERKTTEQNLRDSERTFRDFASVSADFFWQMDEHFRFVQLSENLRYNSNFRVEDILGQKRWEMAGIEDPTSDPIWKNHYHCLLRHEKFKDFRYVVVNHRMEKQYMSTSGVPIFSVDGVFCGYRGTASDRTKEVLADQQRTEAGDRLRMAVDAADLYFWDWELESKNTKWGRDPTLVRGPVPEGGYPDFVSMVHEDDLKVFNEANRACVEDGLSYTCEFRLHTTDGRINWLVAKGTLIRDESGNPERITGMTQIVTKQKEAEQSLRLSATVFQSREAILITDVNGNILDANPAFMEVTGFSKVDLIEKNAGILRSGHHDREFYHQFWRDLLVHGYWNGEFIVRSKNGELIPLWTTINAVMDGEKVYRYVAGYSDLRERKQAEDRIQKLSNFDVLTELPNRSLFVDCLTHEIARCKQPDCFSGILLLDIDGFRTINESKGYHFGDAVLRNVAGTIKECVKRDDIVARIGADEFAILVINVGEDATSGLENLRDIANRMMGAVSKPTQFKSEEMHLSCSMGINAIIDGLSSAEELLRQTELAMHQARQEGYSSSRVFRPNMQQHSDNRLQLQNMLSAALQDNRIECFYQSQVDRDGVIIGVEALARLSLPDGCIVPPDQFIGIAEETGLIVPLGNIILENSLTDMSSWIENFDSAPHYISVNVSPRQFLRGNFVHAVKEALVKYNVPGQLLEFEITEHLLVADFDRVSRVMHSLRDEGVRFAIDDFGVGYSSLEYLKKLPLDKLKIDRSFVMGLADDDSSGAIIDAILSMAKALGLEVVAEGVETELLMNDLIGRGCRYFQGYYFDRPSPRDLFNDRLATANR